MATAAGPSASPAPAWPPPLSPSSPFFAKANLLPSTRSCPNAGKAGGRAWVTVCYLRDTWLQHVPTSLTGLSLSLFGAALLGSYDNIGRLIAAFGGLSTICCGQKVRNGG